MTQILYKSFAAAVAAVLGTAIVPAASASAMAPPTDGDDPVRIEITTAEIAKTNEKAAAAFGALASMWSAEFRARGERFSVPRLVRHRESLLTACGRIAARNASYCYGNNTIYFDDLFLTAQAKLTGDALGTDGDMAAVGIIAHEMGHAVAFQLGARSRSSYANESMADCLAGAFARQAREDGSLEPGDLDEAFAAMAAAADPELEPSGNARVDARQAALLQRSAHGTREQRQLNFRNGLDRGSQGCFANFAA